MIKAHSGIFDFCVARQADQAGRADFHSRVELAQVLADDLVQPDIEEFAGAGFAVQLDPLTYTGRHSYARTEALARGRVIEQEEERR